MVSEASGIEHRVILVLLQLVLINRIRTAIVVSIAITKIQVSDVRK